MFPSDGCHFVPSAPLPIHRAVTPSLGRLTNPGHQRLGQRPWPDNTRTAVFNCNTSYQECGLKYTLSHSLNSTWLLYCIADCLDSLPVWHKPSKVGTWQPSVGARGGPPYINSTLEEIYASLGPPLASALGCHVPGRLHLVTCLNGIGLRGITILIESPADGWLILPHQSLHLSMIWFGGHWTDYLTMTDLSMTDPPPDISHFTSQWLGWLGSLSHSTSRHMIHLVTNCLNYRMAHCDGCFTEKLDLYYIY